VETEHGAQLVRITDPAGETAAIGRVAVHGATAVFDRIETMEAHRRKGLGTVLMHALDALAVRAGASERLLVATEAGRALYASLGWQVLAPYSTAALAVAS
jgi:GNAT superfamily N-acetyltransferase